MASLSMPLPTAKRILLEGLSALLEPEGHRSPEHIEFLKQAFITLLVKDASNLYAGTASAVRLPTCTSAWIENRSGVLQGAPESCPIANLVVGALVRFLQATPCVGFVHRRGCREFRGVQVAQWAKRPPLKQELPGSNPLGAPGAPSLPF